MTMTQLQYFITAAETLNFTTAANRTFATQSALSRQIAMLEQELGAALFTRNNNVLELTEVGHFFYQRASRLYDNYLKMIQETRKQIAGVEGTLRLGLLEDQRIVPPLNNAINRLAALHPQAAIDIYRYNYLDLIRHLEQGTLDIVQASLFDSLSQSLYSVLPCEVEPVCFAFNRNYIACEKESVRISDIAAVSGGCPTILTSTESYPELVQPHLPNVSAADNIRFTDAVSTIPTHVSAGIAVTISVASSVLSLYPDIAMIPIEDAPPITQGVIWPESNTNPLLKQLLRYIKNSIQN